MINEVWLTIGCTISLAFGMFLGMIAGYSIWGKEK